MEQDVQVFVKVDEYKDIIDILSMTTEKMQLVKSLLEKINKLKVEEDQEIDKWNREVSDIDSRLQQIHALLSQS
jgi:D-Tyr-tRNAtyr deacylase